MDDASDDASQEHRDGAEGAVARRRVLTIAGSDSGGGAGIQADLKTIAALGGFGMTAITAVTVQNTKGVAGVEQLSPETVGAQIRAVASDIGVDAAKTGMLASARIVTAVAEAVREAAISLLVVDPVFMSNHGHPLLADDAVGALRGELFPLATLVTPNLLEAAELVGFRVDSRDAMRRAGAALLGDGPSAVLVKGGHLDEDDAADLLVDAEGEEWLEHRRIDTPHTHGTGCVLSAAVATYLAGGVGLRPAVRDAKRFVTAAIAHALALGQGIGPVDPLWDRTA